MPLHLIADSAGYEQPEERSEVKGITVAELGPARGSEREYHEGRWDDRSPTGDCEPVPEVKSRDDGDGGHHPERQQMDAQWGILRGPAGMPGPGYRPGEHEAGR